MLFGVVVCFYNFFIMMQAATNIQSGWVLLEKLFSFICHLHFDLQHLHYYMPMYCQLSTPIILCMNCDIKRDLGHSNFIILFSVCWLRCEQLMVSGHGQARPRSVSLAAGLALTSLWPPPQLTLQPLKARVHLMRT